MKIVITKPDKNKARQKRQKRIRAKISGTAERPRLNVFRSNKNIYAQIIDDVKGVTLASASTLDKEIKDWTVINNQIRHWQQLSTIFLANSLNI